MAETTGDAQVELLALEVLVALLERSGVYDEDPTVTLGDMVDRLSPRARGIGLRLLATHEGR